MVLVAVGDDEAFDFVDVFFQICYIRDDQVDTEHVVFRECKSASTTMILSSYSKTVMFIPICSRPPSGIIFNLLPLFFFK